MFTSKHQKKASKYTTYTFFSGDTPKNPVEIDKNSLESLLEVLGCMNWILLLLFGELKVRKEDKK